MSTYIAARCTVLPLNCHLAARFVCDRFTNVPIARNIPAYGCSVIANPRGIIGSCITGTGTSAVRSQQGVVHFNRREDESEPHCPAAEQGSTMAMADFFDLEKQFAFYGAYHHNIVNVLIHCVFVWPIFLTALVLPAFTQELAPVPLPAGLIPGQQFAVLNWSFVFAALYALYYVALDKRAGSLAAALCLGCWIASNAIAQTLGFALAWKVVLFSQVVCWAFQFLGHGLFEGRTPALFDNLSQAFLMAPFFVLLEILQSLFGYEPYSGFRERVSEKVKSNIARYRAQKQA